MKLLHYRDEYGAPYTIKQLRDGIYYNELAGNWSVYTTWGHAQCATISQAKRTQKSRYTGQYKQQTDGFNYPVFDYPQDLKGGYNRKENHLANHLIKLQFSKQELDTYQHLTRIQRKIHK